MNEWPIAEVARAAGVTSRALRHDESVGLLLPARVAANGYRFYGDAEIARLYRILSLRALDVSLPDIARALRDEESFAETVRAHLATLERVRTSGGGRRMPRPTPGSEISTWRTRGSPRCTAGSRTRASSGTP